MGDPFVHLLNLSIIKTYLSYEAIIKDNIRPKNSLKVMLNI